MLCSVRFLIPVLKKAQEMIRGLLEEVIVVETSIVRGWRDELG